MRKLFLNFLFVALAFTLACGQGVLDGKNVENTKVVQLAFDELKLINPGIIDSADPNTLYTSEYPLHSTSRLLLRLGVLRASTAKIVVEQPVLLRILVKSDARFATEQLKLCPLLTQWMMGATWTKPERNHKRWNAEGGDFDMTTCMSAMKKDDPLFDAKHPEEKEFCAGEEVLCYEIKSYINAYIRARNIDYGVGVLNLTAQRVVIYGDRTVRGPEILWRKLKY